jgi:hypothetical protein
MTTVSVFVSAMLDHISAMAPVLSVLPVSPMPKETLMEHAHARLVTPTLPEFAPSAPKAPSGAHQPISASSSVDKTQHILNQPMPVSATPDSVSYREVVRCVPRDISSQTDTV